MKGVPLHRRSRDLLLFAVVCLAISYLARLLYRADHLLPWELLGPIQGEYLVHTSGWFEAAKKVWHNSRHYYYYGGHLSVFFTLIPTFFQQILPGQHYGIPVSFTLTAIGLALAFSYSGLKRENLWVLLLALGTSPVLLSFSVMGMPNCAALLPHAIALYMVLDPKLSASWWKTLLLGLVSIECSWQLYEIARTNFAVWLVAVVAIRAVPKSVRACWAALAALQIWLVQTADNGMRGGGFFTDQLLSRLTPEAIAGATGTFLKGLFVDPAFSLPFLFVSAMAALILVRKNRWFWFVLLFAQIGLFWLSVLRNEAYSRRFILVEFYALSLTLILFREIAERLPKKKPKKPDFAYLVGRGLVPFLIAGNLLQMGFMFWHFRIPVTRNRYPMPFAWSAFDMDIHPTQIEFSHHLYDRVASGNKIIPIYSVAYGWEWATNPALVLDRVYLRLGHKRYVENVFAFGEIACHPHCTPVYPMARVPELLGQIADGKFGPADRFYLEGLVFEKPKELIDLKAALDAKFLLTAQTLSKVQITTQRILAPK